MAGSSDQGSVNQNRSSDTAVGEDKVMAELTEFGKAIKEGLRSQKQPELCRG